MKKEDACFIGWESEVFGFGYGTGEMPIIKSLRLFLKECPTDTPYDYIEIEEKVGETITWLLINALCAANNLEYGSSTRYAWLTESGKKLQLYLLSKTDDELYEILMSDFGTYEEIEKKDNPLLEY